MASLPSHTDTESQVKKNSLPPPVIARDELLQQTDQSEKKILDWVAMQRATQGELESIDPEVIEARVNELEAELPQSSKKKRWYHYELSFDDQKYFTWIIVEFESMGGLLSGIDQSLISGANLFMPSSLNLNSRQQSLVNSGVPLGTVGGAFY